MKKLGLDPAKIKSVVIAHGHLDHFGGAFYLFTINSVFIALSSAFVIRAFHVRPLNAVIVVFVDMFRALPPLVLMILLTSSLVSLLWLSLMPKLNC